jgi:nicotinate phosphoribosyltransferase
MTCPAMVTDLYELTMAAAYHRSGLDHEASFELSVRRLPAERRFLVAAGLDAALAGLEDFRYRDEDLAYLDSLGLFRAGFLDVLATLRFTGEVWGIPEGEIVFAGEPLVRVTGSLLEAQLVETFLLNQIASNTMVASKAARVALASAGRSFVDFSARRDHGVAAAMTAARAAWIAGAAGTSLVAAGQLWGIPTSGTMAHSFVMAFDDESDAFRSYARTFPKDAVLLLDTYGTLAGAHHVVEVARELAGEGIEIAGVRLDSGDLPSLSLAVRRILDDAGLAGVRVFASGDLDEYRIADLVAGGAAIDAFGVGTQLGTSGDAPSLGAVYKLVEDRDGPKMKLAQGKVTWPGRKQVWRAAERDVLSLHDEEVAAARPLLVPVMAGGQRTEAGREHLDQARKRCEHALAGLPDRLRSLAPYPTAEMVWPVELSAGLTTMIEQVRSELGVGG